MFILFVPLYLQDLGAEPVAIGSVLGLFGLMMMLMHVPAGYLADRLGRRPLLVLGWGIGALSAAVMALAAALPLFVVGFLVYGLTAFISAPLFSYVTAERGSLSAGRVMTFGSAMFAVGAVIGPPAGGWIGEAFGLRMTFAIAAGIFVLSSALILFIRAQPREAPVPEAVRTNVLANPAYVRLLVVLFVASFAMFLAQPLTPNFLQNERQIPLQVMGWIGGAGSIGNVVFNLVLGRGRPRGNFILGQAFVVLFVLLVWLGTSAPWYALGYFVLGGFRVARMLGFAQVRALIHDAQMGLAYGITEAVNALAMVLAPLLAGFLYDGMPASMYPVALAVLAFSITLSALLAPREIHDASPQPAVVVSDGIR